MKKIDKQVCIFDLDGTLIDSVPDLALSINLMLEKLKLATFDESTIRLWVGNGAHKLVKRALLGKIDDSEHIDQTVFNTALKIFLEIYEKNLIVKTTIYPNVLATLKVLRKMGKRLTIVTNKPEAFVSPILNGLKLDGIFELILGGDSLEKKKPDPLPLLYICEKLNVSLDKCVMIGDSKNDIIAAKKAGISNIGVSYGYNYGSQIETYNPDIIVDDFQDIVNCFKE